MPIGRLTKTPTVCVTVQLHRGELERLLVGWLAEREPTARTRVHSRVVFHYGEDGELIGAGVEAVCPADKR